MTTPVDKNHPIYLLKIKEWLLSSDYLYCICIFLALHVSKDKQEKYDQKHLYQNLTPLLGFWKKLNKGQEWLHMSMPKNTSDISPLVRFINDEKRFSLKLMQDLHRSLSAISRITRGTIVPSRKDIEIANSLSAYQVQKKLIIESKKNIFIAYWNIQLFYYF